MAPPELVFRPADVRTHREVLLELNLESGPFMHSAHRLYEAVGFIDRRPYPEAEVPVVLHGRWRFMELNLTDPAR